MLGMESCRYAGGEGGDGGNFDAATPAGASAAEPMYSDVVADDHSPTGAEGDDAYMTVGSTE